MIKYNMTNSDDDNSGSENEMQLGIPVSPLQGTIRDLLGSNFNIGKIILRKKKTYN